MRVSKQFIENERRWRQQRSGDVIRLKHDAMNVFVAGTTAYLPTFPLSGSSLELREPAVTEGSLLDSFLIEHRWFGQWLDGGSLRRALATARSNRGALSTSDLPFNKKTA